MGRTLPVSPLIGIVCVIILGIVTAWTIPLVFIGILLFILSISLSGGFYTMIRAKKQGRVVLPFGLIILSFFLIFLTSGGPFWRDSGEIASSIWSLGVAHPTGFPVIMIAGKSFALLPIGNAFFRINLFETFSLIATGAMISLLLGLIYRRSFPIVFIGIAGFLLSATVLMHGLNTEVYIPSVLGFSIGLAFFIFGFQQQDARAFVAGAFVLGLGLGGHISWPLNLGVAALILIVAEFVKNRRSVPIFPMIVAGIIGMLIVFYLPAVAAHGPARNWGDPSTPGAMLAHITGSSIRHSFNAEIGGFNWSRFLIHLRMFMHQVSSDQYPIFPLTLIGIWMLFRRQPIVAAALIAALVSDVIFTAQINPMGIIDRQTGVTTELIIAIFAGIGGIGLFDVLLSRTSVPRLVPLLILLFFPITQILTMPLSPWYNRSHGPQMVISDVLDMAGNDCTLLTTSDDISGLVAAGRVVEERRPDCLSLVKQHLLLAWHVDYEFSRAGRKKPWQHRASLLPEKEVIQRMVEVVNSSPGPVFFEPGQAVMDRALPGHLVPGYPLYSVVNTGDFNIKRSASGAISRAVLSARASLDVGRRYVSGFLTRLTVLLNNDNDTSQAIRVSAMAVKIDPLNEKSLYNRAIIAWWYEHNKNVAISLLKRAVAIKPDYDKALKTLAKYAGQANKPALRQWAAQQYMAVTGQALVNN